jgi:hypothetical protein
LTTCVDCQWLKLSDAALAGLNRIGAKTDRSRGAIVGSLLSEQEKAAALAVFYGDVGALARWVAFLLSRDARGGASLASKAREAAKEFERVQGIFSRRRLGVISVKKSARRRRRKAGK